MKKVKVWDLPTRIFHWLLPILLVSSWYSAETRAMEWHLYSGYSVLGLVTFRICWGLWGGYTARFSHFVKGPATVVAYIRGQHPSSVVGHNPLGGWSIVALLLVLVVQVTSGLFAVDIDGMESGPLSYLVSFDFGRELSDIHEGSFNVLLALVVVHLLAILWYEFIRKERLILPMLHGHKEVVEDLLAPVSTGLGRILLAIGLAALLAYLVSTGFRF